MSKQKSSLSQFRIADQANIADETIKARMGEYVASNGFQELMREPDHLSQYMHFYERYSLPFMGYVHSEYDMDPSLQLRDKMNACLIAYNCAVMAKRGEQVSMPRSQVDDMTYDAQIMEGYQDTTASICKQICHLMMDSTCQSLVSPTQSKMIFSLGRKYDPFYLTSELMSTNAMAAQDVLGSDSTLQMPLSKRLARIRSKMVQPSERRSPMERLGFAVVEPKYDTLNEQVSSKRPSDVIAFNYEVSMFQNNKFAETLRAECYDNMLALDVSQDFKSFFTSQEHYTCHNPLFSVCAVFTTSLYELAARLLPPKYRREHTFGTKIAPQKEQEQQEEEEQEANKQQDTNESISFELMKHVSDKVLSRCDNASYLFIWSYFVGILACIQTAVKITIQVRDELSTTDKEVMSAGIYKNLKEIDTNVSLRRLWACYSCKNIARLVVQSWNYITKQMNLVCTDGALVDLYMKKKKRESVSNNTGHTPQSLYTILYRKQFLRLFDTTVRNQEFKIGPSNEESFEQRMENAKKSSHQRTYQLIVPCSRSEYFLSTFYGSPKNDATDTPEETQAPQKDALWRMIESCKSLSYIFGAPEDITGYKSVKFVTRIYQDCKKHLTEANACANQIIHTLDTNGGIHTYPEMYLTIYPILAMSNAMASLFEGFSGDAPQDDGLLRDNNKNQLLKLVSPKILDDLKRDTEDTDESRLARIRIITGVLDRVPTKTLVLRVLPAIIERSLLRLKQEPLSVLRLQLPVAPLTLYGSAVSDRLYALFLFKLFTESDGSLIESDNERELDSLLCKAFDVKGYKLRITGSYEARRAKLVDHEALVGIKQNPSSADRNESLLLRIRTKFMSVMSMSILERALRAWKLCLLFGPYTEAVVSFTRDLFCGKVMSQESRSSALKSLFSCLKTSLSEKMVRLYATFLYSFVERMRVLHSVAHLTKETRISKRYACFTSDPKPADIFYYTDNTLCNMSVHAGEASNGPITLTFNKQIDEYNELKTQVFFFQCVSAETRAIIENSNAYSLFRYACDCFAMDPALVNLTAHQNLPSSKRHETILAIKNHMNENQSNSRLTNMTRRIFSVFSAREDQAKEELLMYRRHVIFYNASVLSRYYVLENKKKYQSPLADALENCIQSVEPLKKRLSNWTNSTVGLDICDQIRVLLKEMNKTLATTSDDDHGYLKRYCSYIALRQVTFDDCLEKGEVVYCLDENTVFDYKSIAQQLPLVFVKIIDAARSADENIDPFAATTVSRVSSFSRMEGFNKLLKYGNMRSGFDIRVASVAADLQQDFPKCPLVMCSTDSEQMKKIIFVPRMCIVSERVLRHAEAFASDANFRNSELERIKGML